MSGKWQLDDEERKALGSRLRKAREYLGFSQDRVAQHLGIPRPSLALVESGGRRVAALELKRLAALYQRPVDYFLGDEAIPSIADFPSLRELAVGLSVEDVTEVAQFADFLRGRKEPKAR